MSLQPLFVPTSIGPVAAYARVTALDGNLRGVAVFLTGIFAHGNQPFFSAVARTLAADGIASVEFDYPGTGVSPAAAGYVQQRDAATVTLDVAAWFRDRAGVSDTALIGHCFGGTAALKVAAQDNDVSCVLAFAMPWRPRRKKVISRRLRQELVAREQIGPILTRRLSRGQASRSGGDWFAEVESIIRGIPSHCSTQFVYGIHDEFLNDAIEYERERGLPRNARITTLKGKKIRGFANVADHRTIIEMIRGSVLPQVGTDRLRP